MEDLIKKYVAALLYLERLYEEGVVDSVDVSLIRTHYEDDDDYPAYDKKYYRQIRFALKGRRYSTIRIMNDGTYQVSKHLLRDTAECSTIEEVAEVIEGWRGV